MTFSVLRILGGVYLEPLLQQGQWKLLDYGPNVEIGQIFVNTSRRYTGRDDTAIFNNMTAVEAFKAFISDVGVESPKRGKLIINVDWWKTPKLRPIFQAIIDVFYAATQPQKLFQNISIDCPNYVVEYSFAAPDSCWTDVIDQLKDQVLNEKVLTLVRKNREYPEWDLQCPEFRVDHPKLKLVLEVQFGDDRLGFSLVYL